MNDGTEELVTEALVLLETRQHEQYEQHQQQVLDFEILKNRVLALGNNTDGMYLRKMIEVATNVSMMRVEDKIKEGEARVKVMTKAASDSMNCTITKNGKESKSQRDDVKLLVASLEKRVNELSKDSAKIQKAADAVQNAMDELDQLENKLIDMINQPDPDTDSRISKLEILYEGSESYLPRLEFSFERIEKR